MSKIFICYRRNDSLPTTRSIYERLVTKYGKHEVFLDIGAIPYGVDFAKYARENIGKCEVVLVMIGKQWLNMLDENGIRRLDHPDDYVRLEIEEAFLQKRSVLPVVLDDAPKPKSAELPGSIAPLAAINAADVHTNKYFDGDMKWLLEWIDAEIKERVRTRAEAQEAERQRQLALEESARKERETLARGQREAEARDAAANKIRQESLEKARPVTAGKPEPAKNPSEPPPEPSGQRAGAKPKSPRTWLDVLGMSVGGAFLCGILVLAIWIVWRVASGSADYVVHYLNDSLREPLSAGTSGVLTAVLTIVFIPVVCWIIKWWYFRD